MIKVAVLLITACAAGASLAGWESWLKSSLYRASFETYEPEEDLSDKGADKGSWGSPAVPAGAEAKAELDTTIGLYMRCVADQTGILFTPQSTGARVVKSVMSAMRLNAYKDKLPDLSEADAKGAFAMFAPEEGGTTNFFGWTANGWRMLQEPSVEPVPDQWYEVSMKFLQKKDGAVYVQYRLKRLMAESFVTLQDTEGAAWFLAANGPVSEIVKGIEFRGDGAFKYITGSEPRRGMLISLVPWREMIIDESVYHHDTGEWYAFDYDREKWISTPIVQDGTYYYTISVPEGEKYTAFRSYKQGSEDREVVEFSVRFLAPNDNASAPCDDVCALVRLVLDLESGFDVKKTDPGYRFACLVGSAWHTNATISADVNADYTVEVSLDKGAVPQTVSYRVKKGLGAEAGEYQDIVKDVPISIGDPLFTFFGGIGRVYGIKSSVQALK